MYKYLLTLILLSNSAQNLYGYNINTTMGSDNAITYSKVVENYPTISVGNSNKVNFHTVPVGPETDARFYLVDDQGNCLSANNDPSLEIFGDINYDQTVYLSPCRIDQKDKRQQWKALYKSNSADSDSFQIALTQSNQCLNLSFNSGTALFLGQCELADNNQYFSIDSKKDEKPLDILEVKTILKYVLGYKCNDLGCKLSSHKKMLPNDYITSPNGMYALLYQSDSNLVLYKADNIEIKDYLNPILALGLVPEKLRQEWVQKSYLIMQGDGHVLLKNTSTGENRYKSRTYGVPWHGSTLEIDNEGTLFVKAPNGQVKELFLGKNKGNNEFVRYK